MTTEALMGRKKKDVGTGGRAVKRLVVQATPEWIAFVERGAKLCRTDVSKLVDAAVVEYLRARGITEEAPDRVP